MVKVPPAPHLLHAGESTWEHELTVNNTAQLCEMPLRDIERIARESGVAPWRFLHALTRLCNEVERVDAESGR